MAAIAPRVLITDERQRPMKSIEVLAISRTSGEVISKARTGLDGIANFPAIDEEKEPWFRPQGNRNQSGDGKYGHLRVTVVSKPDADTLPPATMMEDPVDDEDAEPIFLVFTTAPKQVDAGVETSAITIERRDGLDEALTEGDLEVFLYTTSPGGIFWYDPPGPDVPVQVTSVTIPDGQSTVSFTYEDDEAGNPVITASTEELG